MKAYTHHFRQCTVDHAAKLLTDAGMQGLVLAANAQWCTVVLARSTDERARLAKLAQLHPEGVLLYDISIGTRIWLQREQLVTIDNLEPWFEAGLLRRSDAEEIASGSADWPKLLGLTSQATQSERLLLEEFVNVPGAIAVGLEIGVPLPAPRPAVPTTHQQLFTMLLSTGSVELDGAAEGLADEFATRLLSGAPAKAVLTWLMEHPSVAEVYLSDEALQRILDTMGPVWN